MSRVSSWAQKPWARWVVLAARLALAAVFLFAAIPKLGDAATFARDIDNYHVLHARDAYTDDRPAGRIRHLKRLWLETEVLTDAEKPDRFRLGHNDQWWSSKGRTKSEIDV